MTLLLLLLLTACTPAPRAELPDSAPPPPPTGGVANPDYWQDVKPILDRRCVVCHGCYDAPCQLNLSAYEGLTRGAHKKPVYDTTRLVSADPTRLFDDAKTVADWRRKGFFSVLGEPRRDRSSGASEAAAAQAGVLARMLALKRAHPLPAVAPLPDSFDFALERRQHCPVEEHFDDFAHDYPLWGMPYGLPGLTDEERATLLHWLQQGAPYRAPAPLPAAYQERVADWERFLNGGSLKEQLMSRYLFEHLHLVSLYFDGLPEPGRGDAPAARPWFRLVRSRSAPGEPLDVIATRRPYDDPGPERFYYRLQPMPASLLVKTHIPLCAQLPAHATLSGAVSHPRLRLPPAPDLRPRGRLQSLSRLPQPAGAVALQVFPG
jgi:hypothetical protein